MRYDHSSSVVAHQNYTGDSIITYDQSSSSTMTMAVSSQDNTENDYRAFLFATHPTYGMLLLHCTRKEEKPPHFQAPGGHVDKEDFEDAIARSPGESHESPDILILAGKIGAARELYEETGIDIRSALDRLHPVRLWNKVKKKSLFCEFKQRLFFKLSLEGGDFLTAGNKSMNTAPPPLMVKLSDEHQGFIFEPNALKSVGLLVEHSGGKVSKALEKAIKQDEIKSTEDKGDDT